MSRTRINPVPCINCGKETTALKYCVKCKEEISADIVKRSKANWKNNNKEYIVSSSKEYYLKNKERINKVEKKYRDNNKEKINNRRASKKTKNTPIKKEIVIKPKHIKLCERCNSEKAIRKYCKTCGIIIAKERKSLSEKKWRLDNPIKFKNRLNESRIKRVANGKLREYEKKRRATNMNYYLKGLLSKRISMALKSRFTKKSTKTIDLIGCSYDEARCHIENKFQPGMTWENHGRYGWHIDHIIPISSFDLTDLEQQKKCFHYTNLQPLWWRDNLIKSNKLNYKNDYVKFGEVIYID